MCIYDNVLVLLRMDILTNFFFFNKRYNYGNFSLEYYAKSSITSEYSLIPFSYCEIRQCAFIKEGSLILDKHCLRVSVY